MGLPDTFTSPSGRVFTTLKLSDANRPWELDGVGNLYRLRRPRRGDTSAWEYFKGGRVEPVELDEADAIALARHLNASAPPGRAPR